MTTERKGKRKNHDKFLRYFSYWLYFFISVGTPIALIAWQFDIFKKPANLQFTAYGIIAVIIFVFSIRGKMKEAIADMDRGIPKTIIKSVQRLAPYLVCWIILTFLDNLIVQVRFILFWTIVAQVVASCVDIWHASIVQRIAEQKYNKPNREESNA